MLGLPVGGYLLIYVAALAVLFISAFWALDPLSGKIVHTWGLGNFRTLWHDHTYWRIAGRTIGLAAAVTVTDVISPSRSHTSWLGVARPRLRTVLFVIVLLPLWSSYLARIYAWRLILSNDGALNWSLGGLGLPHQHIAYTNWAMWIVFSYIWLPFMILPIYAALERIPDSLHRGLARPRRARTGRRSAASCSLLRFPGVVAGSIFTFSLTLGDYITPILVGNTQFIGNVVYRNVLGLTYNLPFAAAFAIVPLAVMGDLPRARAPGRRVRGALMEGRLGTRRGSGSGRCSSCSSSGSRC